MFKEYKVLQEEEIDDLDEDDEVLNNYNLRNRTKEDINHQKNQRRHIRKNNRKEDKD